MPSTPSATPLATLSFVACMDVSMSLPMTCLVPSLACAAAAITRCTPPFVTTSAIVVAPPAPRMSKSSLTKSSRVSRSSPDSHEAIASSRVFASGARPSA